MKRVHAGAWVAVPPWVKDEAEQEAYMTEPFLRSDDRTEADRRMYLYQGFIGELMYHLLMGEIDWWRANRLKMRGKTSDGGSDTKDGKNVKVVLDDASCCGVSDDRAEHYVVYEYDLVRSRIRMLGSFVRSAIHPITYPNGDKKMGVYLNELQ